MSSRLFPGPFPIRALFCITPVLMLKESGGSKSCEEEVTDSPPSSTSPIAGKRSLGSEPSLKLLHQLFILTTTLDFSEAGWLNGALLSFQKMI